MAVFFNTDDFAEEITYTPVGGFSKTITAILDRDASNQEPYVRGSDTFAMLQVKTSDVGDPRQGDTFIIGTKTWELDPDQGVLEKDDNQLFLSIRRVEP